jgi:putative membrane protein
MTKISKNSNRFIIILSIAIPIVVASLFRIELDLELPVFLPPIYATINAITAIILIIAVWAIMRKKRLLHEKLMKTAIGLSVLFLMLYILYHATSGDTKFSGEGVIRYIYFFILITHIVLSIAIIPLVLITFVRGLHSDFENHKKIAKIAFPLWLYVAISGVIVYLMIAPYY